MKPWLLHKAAEGQQPRKLPLPHHYSRKQDLVNREVIVLEAQRMAKVRTIVYALRCEITHQTYVYFCKTL